ncbi:gamma-glutamylcyclotransferase [Streptomyces sp. NBC_01693]|uniref:gamma-glutamylcyclotransferase n=1 Tax=Streptomyces sp. NBC_01693 TaxID=2975912 RepID=UPI002E3584D4|nr:gamma-glutamylcyclotransferase [Streptomyces sp. NBC_01693]
MSDTGLPFFVYGTLLPGEPNHDRFLRGRTCQERPAVLPGALLYEGPGYPYAVEGHGTVHGALVTAAPGAYAELLGLLDDLEEFLGPGHPRNLYERVAREAVPAPGVPHEPGPGDSGAREPGAGQPGPGQPGPVRAWVYLAAGAVARSLRTGGTLVPGGDWLSRRPPPARRTP